MKISSLLLSSAAILVVGSAFAADLPAKKAAPAAAAAATGCPAFGAGFISIPGTDSCIKVYGYIRADEKYTANVTRPATAPYTMGYKYIVDFDVRNNTEVGTVRSQVGLLAASPTSGGVTADTVFVESAFVEVGGFRAGAAPSPVDFNNAYNNTGVAYQPTQVGLLSYTAPMGATSVTFAAQNAENVDDSATSGQTTLASRPDLLIAATSKFSDAVTVKGGLVSHEVVGSASGTSQGFAGLGRVDVSLQPIKVILGGAYATGAVAYVQNSDGDINGYYNRSMGGVVKDSATDASNLSTASNYYGAVEYALGNNVLYGYVDGINGTQDTTHYKRNDYGVGFKYVAAKGFYIRPEIYQKVENKNASSDTISNVFYLRLRRDF